MSAVAASVAEGASAALDGRLHSALYVGRVRHRRFEPMEHAFRSRLFMVYLDLAELDRVFAGRWLWSTRRPALARFRRRDYLPDAAQIGTQPLDETVRDLVEEQSGRRPTGPVTLLTHLRYFGFGFNPVSFFYCLSPARDAVEAVVAEVHNTPWNETHPYVLTEDSEPVDGPRSRGTARAYEHPKLFHVSPFKGMNSRYSWRFTLPAEKLAVHVETAPTSTATSAAGSAEGSHDGSPNGAPRRPKDFDATLSLERREITGASLAKALLRFPWMTAQVVGGIYFEAARLWLKGAPYHAHPKLADSTPVPATTDSTDPTHPSHPSHPSATEHPMTEPLMSETLDSPGAKP